MNNKVCVVFSGQGNQYVGMGKDLYDEFGEAREMYHGASEVSGIDIRKISFRGAPEEQSDPRNSQLITFVNSCVIYELVKDKFDFGCFAGHSIGELTALYAAGVFGEGIRGFRNGVEIVNERGKLLKGNSFKRSCLVSVLGCEREVVEEFCKGTNGELVIALYNCRGNYVIGGKPKNIDKWIDKIPGAIKVLPVMGPFHTEHYMKTAKKFGKFLEGFAFAEPNVASYRNCDSEFYHAETIADGLVRQLWNPVLWEDIISKVPAETFVEMGPGRSLSGMIKRIRKGSERISIRGVDDL